MPHSLAKLLEKMPSCLVIMNFVDAVHCKVLSDDLAREFIHAWAKKCTKLSRAEEALSKMRSIRESHANFLKNTGNELQKFNGYIFTIMQYDDIYDRFDQKTQMRELIGIHNLARDFRNAPDKVSRSHLEANILQLQKDATEDGYFDVHFKQDTSIKGSSKKLVWITTAKPGIALQDQNCHQSSILEAADITRDNLGLVHIGFDYIQGKQDFPLLIALKIKASELFFSTGNTPGKPWRPTAIDAGSHSRFRGAYGDLRKNAQKWGQAIHLEALSDQSGSLGATEAVVMDFRPKTTKMTFLGFPRIPRGDLPGRKDQEFLENIRRMRPREILKRRFIKI